MENKIWFSARVVFMAVVKGHESDDPMCEESIIIIHAENEADALESARQAGLRMEHGYDSEHGNAVQWKFQGILEVQDLCEETLEDGSEVFSHMFLKSQAESREVRDLLDKAAQVPACATN